MIHLQLFGAFFKIGLFTIGGGLAALPLFQRELLALGWITPTEFIDMVAISQATPGPIGVNMATFAGFRVASYSGAVAATAGLAAPSLIIIVIIARFMKDYAHRPAVRHLLATLRPTAVGMIGAAAWFIFREALFTPNGPPFLAGLDLKAAGLFALLAVVYAVRPAHPIAYIAAGALAGLALF